MRNWFAHATSYFQVEPGVPLAQMLPHGRVRKFAVRVTEDEIERCRPFGLMRRAVVGGQQPDYRRGTRFRLADAERLHTWRATVRNHAAAFAVSQVDRVTGLEVLNESYMRWSAAPACRDIA